MVTITAQGETHEFDMDDPELPDWIADDVFTSGHYPYEKKLKRRHYERELETLSLELIKVQRWQEETGEKIVIVFEGRDAAGKGGTIGALREYLNPRAARIVALAKPTRKEMGQWYYQRYVEQLPTSGEMVMFDRSWYNRAGVERVMGFTEEPAVNRFLRDTPDFERLLVSGGIHLFKIWLNVGQEMQLKRFHDRRHNPLKSWKLSPMDMEALTRWDDYTRARDIMLAATHTDHAPWTIVRSNDKRRARLNTMRHVLSRLDYSGKDENAIGEVDDKVVGLGPAFLNEVGA